MNKMLLKISLDLFDGAAASGTGAGDGSASAGNAQGEAQGAVPGNTRRGKSGEYANVVFGKQAENVSGVTEAQDAPQVAAADTDKGVHVTSDTLEDKRKAFEKLVSGEYKDIYTEETQRIINKRFRETESLRAKVDESQPLLDLLSARYGVKNGNVKDIISAVENDNAYWQEAADEAGMNVEQYKRLQKLERENDALKRADEEKKKNEFIEKQTTAWFKEAEALKDKFPAFDFGTEIQNPAFIAMLKSGTPVEHAYKVLHFDELIGSAVNVTAARTQQAVVANVRARGARPQENGTVSQSAFTVKDDVSKLTKADRAEIAKRAARGEIISF